MGRLFTVIFLGRDLSTALRSAQDDGEGEHRSGQSDDGKSAPLWTEGQVDRGTGEVSTRSAQDGKASIAFHHAKWCSQRWQFRAFCSQDKVRDIRYFRQTYGGR